MNLKRLKDSLYVNSEGEWVYHSMKYQKAIERVGVSGFGSSRDNVAKNGGIYSLLKIEQVEAPGQDYPPSVVRRKIKKDYKSITGWKQMLSDLESQFKKVVLTELGDIDLAKNPRIIATYPESSSTLLEDFVKVIQPLVNVKGKFGTIKVKDKPSFTKSKQAWFDYDALEEDLKKRGKSDDEILQALTNAEAAWKSFVKAGYKLSGSYMKSMFRQYVRGLFEESEQLDEVDVIFVIDDSLTTGASMRSMMDIASKKAKKVIPVTLFKQAGK